MNILDIIQNRNNQLYGVVNFILLIYVFSNRAKDKSKIIFIKNTTERIFNPITNIIIDYSIGYFLYCCYHWCMYE